MKPSKHLTFLAPQYIWNSSYCARALETVRATTAQLGCSCDLRTEEEIVRSMQNPAWHGRLEKPGNGIVVFSPYAFDYDGYLRLFRSQGYPCVLIRRKARVPGVVVLRDDDTAGTHLALEHLYRLGHRAIGAFRSGIALSSFERKNAWQDFMQRRGLPGQPPSVYARLCMYMADEDQLRQLLAAPEAPTAFFCFIDSDALVLVEQLQRLGKRVPQDVAVIGYDDDEESQNSRPPLTTVRVPIEEMCTAACRLIIEQKTETSPPEVVFPNTLVVRESCGAKLAEKAR